MPRSCRSSRMKAAFMRYGPGLARPGGRKSVSGARRGRWRGLLALAGVEDLAGVEGTAYRGLQRERARVEFAAHAVPFQDADAVLAGHRAAQGDGRVEELLERRLGRRPGGRIA